MPGPDDTNITAAEHYVTARGLAANNHGGTAVFLAIVADGVKIVLGPLRHTGVGLIFSSDDRTPTPASLHEITWALRGALGIEP